MNVKRAKERIEKITMLCKEIEMFDKDHGELSEDTLFLCQAVGFLCDYRRVLEDAIERAELDI